MLIQKIQWWLWNQMFQYAFIKALSLRSKTDFKLDISEYETYFRPYELEIFNIQKIYAKEDEVPFYEKIQFKNRYLNWIFFLCIKPILFKLNGKHFKEREWKFESDFINKNKWYFDWYFQCEKYFKDFEPEIRKDFTFKNTLSKKNTELLKKLEWKNIVSVHIRRWDYLNKPDFHPICSLDYYNEAIKYIYNIENPIFLFFSDDTERVKENFKWDNYYYIDRNTWKDSWQDMALMSRCKHNIIANSSFSRWWAWLNDNHEKIIIAPKLWSNRNTYNSNCVPENWIQF